MRKLLLASTMILLPLVTANADPLIALPQNITITGNGIQGGGAFSDTFPFFGSPETALVDGGLLNVFISIVPDPSVPQSEWLVFKYLPANRQPIWNGSNEALNEVGITFNVPTNFIGVSNAFIASNGQFLTETNGGVFGQTLHPNSLVPGESALGQTTGNMGFVDPLGFGPAPALGQFMNPSSQLSNFGINVSQVFAFEQALQFAPATIIPPPPPPPPEAPEPASLTLLGVGLLGTAVFARRRRI